ncbi:hypothetical protein ACIQZI_11075 [Peribacillus sp. NPDC096379]|uniref:hypothetical protein n=1 Tax=Peribacillus sp. NPDC096379 TaxID=3364393 RepID=UPI00382597FA
MQPYYFPAHQYYPAVPSRNGQDERFFPFLLPFVVGGVAGLATGSLLFNNRPPYYLPYPPPAPYPYPYPPYNPYQGYPGYQAYPQSFGAQAGVSENINIYTSPQYSK